MSEIQTYRVHNPHSLKMNKVRSYETKPFTILKYVEGPCNRHFDLIDLSGVSFVSSCVWTPKGQLNQEGIMRGVQKID